MIPQPAIIALVAADAAAAVLIIAACVAAVRLLLGHAGVSGAERTGPRLALGGAALFLAASAAGVVVVANLLPGAVPGAMCGAGVLDAMGASGERATWLRALALLALGAWHVLDRLDRSSAGAPLRAAAARALLAAAPLAVLAAAETARAFLGLDVESRADCCAALYDSVRAGRAAAPGLAAGVPWTSLAIAGGAALAAAALLVRRVHTARQPAPWVAALVAALAWLWALAAARALAGDLAASITGAPGQACAWCLLTARGWFVGYPLVALAAVAAAESLAALIAAAVARRSPEAAAAASRRAARALVATAVAALAFVALALALLLALR